jgi:protoheme IX farnesyltransferase
VGGTIAAGSANAINCYLDRDIDEVMRRTRKRPLPAHLVEPDSALAFGFVLGAISFFFLSIAVNMLAASLALSAIAFYVFVYTMWLKRTSVQNIVIGGAAGAVPALVGWAAVTGTVGPARGCCSRSSSSGRRRTSGRSRCGTAGTTARPGIPMLPVVRGPQETRKQILLYSLVLFGTSLLLVPVASMGPRLRGGGSPAGRLVRLARAPPLARDLAGRVDAPCSASRSSTSPCSSPPVAADALIG